MATPRQFATLQTGTPRHLAEQILTSRSSLEGERKRVTVLFADMKGSMELLANRDPEEARAFLDPVLQLMMDAVHRYEGTVNQVLGDGIMALFGAPLAYEDHAVRACYAALRMQEAVKRYAEEVQRREAVLPEIRIGLNSGEVVVRSIGGDLRMDYTAVGQTTHLASRMEQMAAAGSILISVETLRLAEGFVEVRPVGPVDVRGLSESLEAYELTSAGPIRMRFEAAAIRGLTHFVGREAELGHLEKALDLAGQGHGQVVTATGDPGVGKSRLFFEFTHSHRMRSWLRLEVGSLSHGQTTPYLPVIDLLKGYFQIGARDDAESIREKVTRKLLALDRSLEPMLPALLTLLDVSTEDSEWLALDPPQRRQRMLESVKRLLLRESQAQPLLLVFEDLQWSDSETQAFLDTLLDSLPTARLLLLVSYRPEYQPHWATSTTYSAQLHIEPLPPGRAKELLRVLLGDDRELEALERLLIERTDGNPFFLEESVRGLVETGALLGTRGAYRLARAIESVQVPATVQAVLAARIDRLSPHHKRLLQAAAVIGHDVPFVLLRGIAELGPSDLRRGLSELQRNEFLYETSHFPEVEYRFKHTLTHEVAYGSLLHERRRVLHARIVQLIERLYPGRLNEQVDRLAHHAMRAEVWTTALVYLRQAGEKAFARSAYREAVAWSEQALFALRQLPETRETREQAIDVRFDLRNALLALGEHERIRDHLREAEALAEMLGDRRRTARALVYKTTYCWNAGDPEGATQSGGRALAIASELADLALEVVANIGLAWAYHALGEYGRAIRFLERTATSLQGDLIWQRFGLAGLPAVVARTWLAWCLTARGEFAASLASADEGMRIAREADHPYSLTIAHFGLGVTYLGQGQFEDAIVALERGLKVSREFNIRTWLTGHASALGYACALSGRVEEALPLLAEAVETAAAIGTRCRQSERVAWLSEALLLARRPAEAGPLAEEALQLARRHKERGHEAQALRLLGELAMHTDPPDTPTAHDRFRQALALASELEMRPLVAQCHFDLGQLGRRTGLREQAESHFRTATELFGSMGMRRWQERLEAGFIARG
jgi:class 3 adenylate cyclase/tetratricopeptide (TPR) repeat protein